MHREVWLPGQIRYKHRLWAQEVRQEYFRGWWHDAHQRSEPQFSPTSRKPRTRTLDNSVFPQCFESSVSHVSHDDFALQKESKESMQSGKPLLDREREERRFCGSVLHSRCQRKKNGTVLVWVRGVTENSFLKSVRKFYSDGWDLREHLQRTAQQAIISVRIGNEEIRIRIDWVTAWAINGRSSSTWENTLV